MSVVLFPLRHEKFWQRYLLYFLLLTFVSPTVITYDFLISNSRYYNALNSTCADEFGIISTANPKLQGYTLLVVMCICTLLGVLFNGITIWKIKKFSVAATTNRQRMVEKKLFVHGLISFLVDSFATMVMIGKVGTPIFRICSQILPWASHAITFVSGFVLIVCSYPLRKAFKSQIGWEVSVTTAEILSRHVSTTTAHPEAVNRFQHQ